MSVDDVIDLIRATTWATVREMLSAGRAEVDGEPRPLESSEREAIRARYDELQRQREPEREPTRSELVEQRRERRWGGR
jgi:hypothetical protein